MCIYMCTGAHVWQGQGWCQMSSASSFHLNKFLRQCLWVIPDVINLPRLSGQQSLEMAVPLLPTCWYLPVHTSPRALALCKGVGFWMGMLSLAQQALNWPCLSPAFVRAVSSMCKVIIGTRYNPCRLISRILGKQCKCTYSVSLSNYGMFKPHATQRRSMTSLYSFGWENAVCFSGLPFCFVIIFSSKLPFWSIFLFKCVSLGHLLVIFQYLIFFEKKCILALFPNPFPLEQLQNK